MDYVKKSENSLVIMKNGNVVKSDNVQSYEDLREKRIQGMHNGKAFMYIQKKPKFSLFPEKHVSFRKIPPSSLPNISYINRTPTPYPISKRSKHKKHFSQKKKKSIKKNNKTKNNKK